MRGATTQPVRSTLSLSLRSLFGTLWFSLWFFVVFPALILFWTGQSWAPVLGFSFWFGIGLVAAAHIVLVAEIVAFVRRGGTHVPFDPPQSLVASGLYSRVRNPMYASYVLIAIGEAIAYRSWALLGYSAILAAVAHGYVIHVEEPDLRRRFGKEYERLVAESGRWLPRIREGS